jgi:hypothetical protein
MPARKRSAPEAACDTPEPYGDCADADLNDVGASSDGITLSSQAAPLPINTLTTSINASAVSSLSTCVPQTPTSVCASPTRCGGGVATPLSPGKNKQLFLAGVTPQSMNCDLRSVVPGVGVKLNLVAILLASFPAQPGPPARRHILLCDAAGSTGLTVWHSDVNKFPKDVLGGVVTVQRASVAIYQGKKSLVLNKDSSIEVDTVTPSPMATWWQSLAAVDPLPLSAAVSAADTSVISVFGVIAFIAFEVKTINGIERRVTTIHLASQTAKFQLRGWDLAATLEASVSRMQDCIVAVRRVRVTSFAETKIGEILDSPLGTLFTPFEDPALAKFWSE